jgi:methylmalonyl-CoA mutase N-terminal domain/subunit
VLPAIESGFFQREIAESAFRYQQEIDREDRYIVGVNAFNEDSQYSIPILEISPDGYRHQVERLAELRRTRDVGAVGQTLDRLRIACQGTENTMPFILAAVQAHATLGEIVGVMKGTFGTYQEPSWI